VKGKSTFLKGLGPAVSEVSEGNSRFGAPPHKAKSFVSTMGRLYQSEKGSLRKSFSGNHPSGMAASGGVFWGRGGSRASGKRLVKTGI